MSKVCSRCQEEKDSSEFYKTSGNRCKSCHNLDCSARMKLNPEKNRERVKRWYNKNPENKAKAIKTAIEWQTKNKERNAQRKFKYNLKRNYNISYEEYCEMSEKQNGLCAICKKEPYRNFDVDHCHKTGKIRALLCSPCNTVLGLVKENIGTLEAVINYIKQHNSGRQVGSEEVS